MNKCKCDRLNREDFALLDEMLAARRDVGLSQAQIAERMGTKAPAVTRLERALGSRQAFSIRRYAAQIRSRVRKAASYFTRVILLLSVFRARANKGEPINEATAHAISQ